MTVGPLFLPKIDRNRNPRKIPICAELVFDKAAVGLLDVLGEVDEQGELRRGGRELHGVLDLDVLALDRRGRVVLDDGQQVVVELRGGDAETSRFDRPL